MDKYENDSNQNVEQPGECHNFNIWIQRLLKHSDVQHKSKRNTNRAIDDRWKTEVVEYFCAIAPDGYRSILAQALVIKAVDLSDLTAFMISTYECDSIRISNLRNKWRIE